MGLNFGILQNLFGGFTARGSCALNPVEGCITFTGFLKNRNSSGSLGGICFAWVCNTLPGNGFIMWGLKNS